MSMFSCPACCRRAIHNLTVESSPLLSNARSQTQRPIPNRPSRRHHATYDSLVTGHHRRAFRLTLQKNDPIKPNTRRKGAGSFTRGEIRDAKARQNNRDVLLSKDSVEKTDSKVDERKQMTRLRKDVEQYYPDPLELANAVTQKLRVPDFEGAYALVRASEGIVVKNVVSWNHCIDWCMSQGDTEKAWKLYNELKKRGHRPDSHTYTIMLRGLSLNSRKMQSAQRAVGIYNSMFAPNSAVVPNTIHTNAVLNVCARTGDMESLWAIAGRLPERGSGSPDRWTFTTILNAIREDATARVAELLKNSKRHTSGEDEDGLTLEERQKVIFDEALKDGRKLWADVSFRWRRADLVLDEQLVCAMGRLILGCGTRNDFEEVFDLVDSTMDIKLAERGHKKGNAAEAPEDEEDIGQRPSAEKENTALTKAERSNMPLSREQIYATPGRNTLSLILEAATGGKGVKLGKAYWHVLTTPNGPYKIAPDADNIISYLRLLRISRSSKDVLDILSREWPDEIAEKLYRRSTFVIAMSTCIRDKNNPRVFDTADKLLSVMQDKLEEAQVGMYSKMEATENLSYKERQAAAKARIAQMDDKTFGEDEALSELQRMKSGVESSLIDPKALRMYLDLATLKTVGWNEGLAGKDGSDETFERNATKNTMLRALQRLGPDMININRLAKLKLLEAEVAARPYADASKHDISRNAQRKAHDRAGTRVAEKLEDLIDLLRTTVGAYDRVISIHERFEDQGRPTLNVKLVDNYRQLKRRISAFLTHTKEEVQKITRGDLKYVQWRNKPRDEEEDDEKEDANQMPKIGREIRQIYEDTDRDIGRLDQRSRRQKLERKQGVQTRMMRRLGVGEDVGVLDEELNLRKKEEVVERMRRRAFGIKVDVDGKRDSQAEQKKQRRKAMDSEQVVEKETDMQKEAAAAAA